jgi:hypothetical protein
MALGQEIAAQAVSDLAGINPNFLLLGRCDGAQHQGMRQPLPAARAAADDRRSNSDFAFLVNLAARILDAKADRLLVHIQPDVIHNVH